MTRTMQYLLAFTAATLAGAAFADVTLFENENFTGRQFMLDQITPNLDGSGFNDRARSAIVRDRAWELCNDAGFSGGCTVFPPGRYPDLGGLTGRVSSARPVAGPPQAMPPQGGPPPVMPPQGGPPPGGPIGSITFYEFPDLGGRQFHIDQTVPAFAGRYNDRAQSAIVEGGPWEICADPDFHGQCRIFVPGRYPNLGGLGGRVSSARPAHTEPPPMGGRPPRAAATLFSGPNFTGRAFPLGSEGAGNLEGMFNDRAESLRVERGYWIFCSDANFSGECRTFGPGEYAYLPPGLNNRISSGRRISNEYPYNAPPAWR